MNRLYLDVSIGGRDVSSVLAPLVQQVTVTDGSDNEADSATIVLADNDGRTFIANARDPVTIAMGREAIGTGLVFEGFVNEPRSRGNQGDGRTLAISCSSVDHGGKTKEPLEKHWDEQPLGSILQDAFAGTGISMVVDPAFAAIDRLFESMDGRDPLTFASDMAREVGATFKMMGSRAVFAQRNTGLALTGAAIPTFVAAWGDNLLEWDITPIVPWAAYSQAIGRWFDFDLGDWKEEVESLVGEAKRLSTIQRPGQDFAKNNATASKTGSERDGGAGSIKVRGDYRAMAGGRCRVQGARPGIDGTYIIKSVTHTASAEEGWVTTIELGNPGDGAGVDSR